MLFVQIMLVLYAYKPFRSTNTCRSLICHWFTGQQCLSNRLIREWKVPPKLPKSFFFFRNQNTSIKNNTLLWRRMKKMNNNNLLCDKQCYSSEAIISKINNTITSSLARFLTIKMQSRVSLWKLCKTWKKLSYVNSHHNLITITFTLSLVLVWWYKFPYTVAELFGTFFAGDFCNKKTVNSPRVK